MRINNSIKKCIYLLLLPTILLFIWTKELPQNNKEYLFLNKDLAERYNQFVSKFGHDDQVIIALPIVDLKDETILIQFNQIKETLDNFKILNYSTPIETTKKKLPSEWIQFYKNHPLMDFKLATDKQIFLVAQIPNFNDQEQKVFYTNLNNLPFKIDIAGMSYTNFHLV